MPTQCLHRRMAISLLPQVPDFRNIGLMAGKPTCHMILSSEVPQFSLLRKKKEVIPTWLDDISSSMSFFLSSQYHCGNSQSFELAQHWNCKNGCRRLRAQTAVIVTLPEWKTKKYVPKWKTKKKTIPLVMKVTQFTTWVPKYCALEC